MAYALDTLYDITRAMGVDGKPAKIADVLSQTNDMMLDIPWYPSNQTMSQVSTLATSEPAGTFRAFNEPTGASKMSTEQISDGCAMLEDWSNIDCALADMSGDANRYRENKDKAFIRGMGKTVQANLAYGTVVSNSKGFTGLAPRYNSTSTGRGKDQIIKAGGSGGDNTSIWLVQWGEDKIHGIYPKDTKAGLDYENKGKVTISPTSGTFLDVYQGHYKWYMGLHIVDYRCAVRIANVDISDLKTAGDSSDTSANLLKFMSVALDTLPDTTGNVAFYANNIVMSMLRVKLMNKTNTFLTLEDWKRDSVERRGMMKFMGFPVRRVDQITNAETAVA